MKKLIFAISVILLLFSTKSLYSQYEQEIDTGYFYDEGVNTQVIYYKHRIEGILDTNRFPDTTFMIEVRNFLSSKGTIIKEIYYDFLIGGISMVLPDSIDALDVIEEYRFTGYFSKIFPTGPMWIKSNRGNPNDSY